MEEQEMTMTAETEAGSDGVASNSVEDTAPPFWDGATMEDKLSYAATLYGVPEESLIDGLLRQSGDTGAGWQDHLESRRKKAEDDLTGRLAAEFDELTAEVPEIREIADLPREVVGAAVGGKSTLLDAYLRDWYRQYRATSAQQARQQRAADCAAGSLAGNFEEPDPKETAFSRAFHTALA